MLLKDKISVISGAAGLRGIGFATARRFADEGATVVILDLDEKGAQAAARELGNAHLGLRCDVTKKDECVTAIERVVETYGRVDALLNNAGITQTLSVWDIDEKSWDRMLDVNLRGVLNLTQAVIPTMREQRSGSIVHTSSGAVHSGGGFVGTAHYCAAKGGVIALGRAMARELGPFGVRVNCIAPGYVPTDINVGKVPEDKLEEIRQRTHLKRLGAPADIANAFAFLASDLSSYITGHVLDVNGGMFMN